jgi:probable rRNA maturation factor
MKSLPDKLSQVSLIFMDDGPIQLLNRKYRGMDYPTDVLSFPMTEKGQAEAPAGQPVMMGDIAISIETARRQAEKAGQSLKKEIVLLLCHGFLHLMHYDDEEPKARRKMLAEQKRCMELFEKDRLF